MEVYLTSGDDVYNGIWWEPEVIYGLDGHDYIWTGGGNDRVYGGAGSDILLGGIGDDALYGEAGDDYLRGWTGRNILHGGDGFDRAAYSGSNVGVSVSLLLQNQYQNTGFGLDMLIGIENVSGTVHTDRLTGDDNRNILWGIYGNDHLIGHGGDDLLSLNSGNGVLDGGSGVDTVAFINGHVENLSGLNISLERQGVAQDTGSGFMTLISIENLSGGAGNDRLIGDSANNILAGAAGSDILSGGAGDDTLLGDGEISMGRSPLGSSGPVTVYDDSGGAPGDDILDGGEGNDILAGGSGADLLTGGAGADIFRFGSISDSLAGASDLIQDFRGRGTVVPSGVGRYSRPGRGEGDVIDLSAIDANGNADDGDQAFALVRGGFTGAGGEMTIRTEGGNTFLDLDIDGDMIADMTIGFTGQIHFTPGDFIL